jgi:hypothetical protein
VEGPSNLEQRSLTEGKGSVQLTSLYLDQLLFILKHYLPFFTKQATLIRRPTVLLSLPPQLGFPNWRFALVTRAGPNVWDKKSLTNRYYTSLIKFSWDKHSSLFCPTMPDLYRHCDLYHADTQPQH